jgi:hypothetical protein
MVANGIFLYGIGFVILSSSTGPLSRICSFMCINIYTYKYGTVWLKITDPRFVHVSRSVSLLTFTPTLYLRYIGLFFYTSCSCATSVAWICREGMACRVPIQQFSWQQALNRGLFQAIRTLPAAQCSMKTSSPTANYHG